MKRRSRKRPRRKTNQLDFQRLEAKQLLAGDFMGSHQVAGELPAQTNIIVNGDFEDVTPGEDNFYTQDEVAGWLARDANSGQELNLFNFGDYGLVLDLDSTIADFDRVYQNVPTISNTEYLVTFDFRDHPGDNPGATPLTNSFEVWWNGEMVGRFTGGSYWQTGTVLVTSSEASVTELLFCEIPEAGAPGGDGQGPLLDNIRVIKANEISLSNHSFENTPDSSSVFFRPKDVEGWNAMGAVVADRWVKIFESDAAIPDATDGDQYLNLDATSRTHDAIFRNLETIEGDSYYVTFDFRVDGDQSTDPDELRVRWNNSWAGTFKGSNDWQTVGMMLKADSSETRLTFLEPGETKGDGSGPLIDNVRIFQIPTNEITVDTNGPAIGTDGSVTYIPGVGAQPIGQQIKLFHQSGNDLTSVIVTLDNAVDGKHERLWIRKNFIPEDASGDPKITLLKYNSATRQLHLTGTASVNEYQAILNTLSYFNGADTVSTSNRTVVVTAFDNTLPVHNSSTSSSINLAIETDQAKIDDTILQKYIADNDLDAVMVADGLYAVIDEPGSGQNPTINSIVRVKYRGYLMELNSQKKLVEGTTFDFSPDEGATFSLSRVIRGWQLGIPVFKTGGSGKLLISSALAYGPGGSGSDIPPNSVLVFDVELKQIIA